MNNIFVKEWKMAASINKSAKCGKVGNFGGYFYYVQIIVVRT